MSGQIKHEKNKDDLKIIIARRQTGKSMLLEDVETLNDDILLTNENMSVNEDMSVDEEEQKEEKQKPNPVFVPRHIAHRKKRW